MTYDLHILAACILKKIRIIRENRKQNKLNIVADQNISNNLTDVVITNNVKDRIKYSSRFSIYWSMSSILLENEQITLRKARIHKFSDCSSNIIQVEQSSTQSVCIPEYFNISSEQILEYQAPEINIYMLNNVKIFGETNIILTADQSILLNNLFFTSGKRLDLKYGFLAGTQKDTAYYADVVDEETIAQGIYLINPANYNYYHFIYETLSRLIVADYDSSLKKWPILVDECVQKYSSIMHLLDRLRVSHEIIWIKKNKKYLIRELAYPEIPNWMPSNILFNAISIEKDYMISKKFLYALSERLNFETHDSPRKNIYVSRKNLSTSRLNNEKDVEQIFSDAGFEIIHPETMSLEEQAVTFHNAEYVAGVSGGALSNIIFCHPGTTLICIFPEEFHFYLYSTIAHNLGLKNIFLDANISCKTPYVSTATFTLNLSYLRNLLLDINGKSIQGDQL